MQPQNRLTLAKEMQITQIGEELESLLCPMSELTNRFEARKGILSGFKNCRRRHDRPWE